MGNSNMRWAPALLAALAVWMVAPSLVSAQLQGDCNENGSVSIGEVVTCSNIFLAKAPLESCPECDQNANQTVSIGEVQGAGNCFSNPGGTSCRMITPAASPTPTPTNTQFLPTATNTPAPPTATDTPVPPTATNTAVPPTATNTPVPTATATATFTETPEPTATPTEEPSDGITLDVTLRPPGGTSGNCRGTCSGGSSDGLSCGVNNNCPGGTCAGPKTCVGGPFDGNSCTSPNQCTTCRGNFTGDPDGSCAIIQGNLVKVVIAPNGVCAPRSNPDVPCASTAECPFGKTCELPGFRMTIDSESDADGVRMVTVDPDSFSLPPAPVPIGGFTACISAGGEGVGFLDCDGGEPGIDVNLGQDHNTTPGSAGNSGVGVSGFADDPNCDMPIMTQAGTLDFPCLEGSKTCSGGDNDQQRCDSVADCPGGTACTPCAQNDPPNFGHEGICNSGVRTTLEGTFDAGDLFVVLPLAIVQLQDNERGPDGLPCTDDDTPAEAAASVPVVLSTGTNSVRIFDANNNSILQVAPEARCGFADCVAQVQGMPLSCSELDATGDISGAAFGGGFPALDIQVTNDIATTFNFVIQSSEFVD